MLSYRVLWVVLCFLMVGCSAKQLPLHNEEAIDWKDLRGQWVFINYWAQWCKPCIKEIPELNQFAKSNARARVFGVYYDPVNSEQLSVLQKEFDVGYSLITQDPFQMLGYERPKVLPATIVFDPQGYVRQVLFGPQTQKSLGVWLQEESAINRKEDMNR
jgi:thiol-disulfide isomerase/thioredoxin